MNERVDRLYINFPIQMDQPVTKPGHLYQRCFKFMIHHAEFLNFSKNIRIGFSDAYGPIKLIERNKTVPNIQTAFYGQL